MPIVKQGELASTLKRMIAEPLPFFPVVELSKTVMKHINRRDVITQYNAAKAEIAQHALEPKISLFEYRRLGLWQAVLQHLFPQCLPSYTLCAVHTIMCKDEQLVVERLSTEWNRPELAEALGDFFMASRDADGSTIEQARRAKKDAILQFAEMYCCMLEVFCILALLFFLPVTRLYAEQSTSPTGETTARYGQLISSYDSDVMQTHILMLRTVDHFFIKATEDNKMRQHVAGAAYGAPYRSFRLPLITPSVLLQYHDLATTRDYTARHMAVRPFKVKGIIPADFGSEQHRLLYEYGVPEHYHYFFIKVQNAWQP